jgi:two-component system alkaline phosphatase synthesis response regulator PhoP
MPFGVADHTPTSTSQSAQEALVAKRILVVDDDLDFTTATGIALESGGYTVDVVHNGEECLRRVKADAPDLIVLDVMMPGMDGWEVCKTLKDSQETRSIPILMLTAVGSEIRKTAYTPAGALETEADDYVAKPVEPQALLERVSKLL